MKPFKNKVGEWINLELLNVTENDTRFKNMIFKNMIGILQMTCSE